LKDPSVCISDNDYDCYTDDIEEFKTNGVITSEAGEIPYNGDAPQVSVEVPDNHIGDVTEYGFGYWFRFQYRYPAYLPINTARNNFLAMAGVTENDDWTDSTNCGDRALAVYYVSHNIATKPTYRFSSYDNGENGDNCNPYVYSALSQSSDYLEGEWYYFYVSYSTEESYAYAHMTNQEGTL